MTTMFCTPLPNEYQSAGGIRKMLPKNLHEYTFGLIWSYLQEQIQAVTAEQVGRGLGLSRSTTRRYLEYCCEQGLVERRLLYRGVGRPEHVFRLSGALPKDGLAV